MPALWNGLGGYDFYFYGPLPFFVNIHLVGLFCPACGLDTKMAIGGGIMLFASALAFYKFARLFSGRKGSAVGAAVYALLPYHLSVDWFVRQAIGEAAAYAFLPIAAYGAEKIMRNEGNGATMALGVSGLMMTHAPTTLLAAHVFGAVVLVRLLLISRIRLRTRALILLRLTAFAFLGLALSTLVWLPAIVLLNNASPEFLFDDGYYHPRRWLFDLRFEWTSKGIMRPVAVAIALSVGLIVLAITVVLKNRPSASGLVWVLVPSVLSLLMMTEFSEKVWHSWIIDRVQFPWRMMVLVEFSAALGVACALGRVGQRSNHIIVVALLAAVIAANGFLFFRGQDRFLPAVTEWSSSIASGTSEYLPAEVVNAVSNSGWRPEDVPLKPHVMSIGETVSKSASSGVAHFLPRRIVVETKESVNAIDLRHFYWPYWQIQTAPRDELKLSAHPETGLMRITAQDGDIPPGRIEIRLPLHWSESVGAVISAISIALILMVSFFKVFRSDRFKRGISTIIGRPT